MTLDLPKSPDEENWFDQLKHWARSDVLGQGGFGRVVKYVRNTEGAAPQSPSAVKYFFGKANMARKEASSLSALKDVRHFAQMKGYWISQDGKVAFIVEELLPQDMLKSLSESPEKFNSSLLLNISKQAFETLIDLRTKGCVHSDIKPQNMSYDMTTGEWKLYDPGIAVNAGTTGVRGTTNYYSPQMILEAAGVSAFPRSPDDDTWAIGISLLETFTGTNAVRMSDAKETDFLHIFAKKFGDDFIKYLGKVIQKNENGLTLDLEDKDDAKTALRAGQMYLTAHPPINQELVDRNTGTWETMFDRAALKRESIAEAAGGAPAKSRRAKKC